MHYKYYKHFLDIVLIILLSPLIFLILIVTAIFIKISEHSAPVIFCQSRMGLNGQRFLIYKFRSMLHLNKHTGKFATDEQYRITHFGQIIRKYRIDELPQVLNIINGDMNLIGPRPEQYDIAKKYIKNIDDYSCRHQIRPGITGLAQVRQGYTDSEDGTRAKLKNDLEYIENLSFKNDLKIVIRTIKIILTGFGAK